ncbi:LysR family transcriptional regulator [Kibdelosporangium philippinense]|uniref:LysR family transcriptional regulator n=1 Tax=Kibdelosporangium philippinense TaxID=211113 RepID=A0ABS8ZCK6_9PSEU|nr:LysR family transcriptional regulator [Kibdelosporangium philippinense]MCE7004753.1 LysR family transcriptional regulator [Kibdelosporangium philippinense]
MRLDFRHLELIVAIGNTGSLRRAAAELHLTQPAVTTQLRRIEQHLGGALFIRDREGAQPTHLGTQVLQHAKQVLGQLGELERTAWRTSTPVRVAGVPAQQYALLVKTLKALLPNDVVSCTHRSTRQLLSLLATGEVDVAVLREFPGFPLRLPPLVEHRLMLVEPIFVGVHEGHRLAFNEEVSLSSLASESWVMPNHDDSGMNEFFAAACREAGFEQRITDFTTESHVAFTLTASGRVICPLYPIGTNRDGLATLPLTGNPLTRKLFLAWRTDWPEASLVDEICADIDSGYRELVANTPVYARWWARSRKGETVGDPGYEPRGAVGARREGEH